MMRPPGTAGRKRFGGGSSGASLRWRRWRCGRRRRAPVFSTSSAPGSAARAGAGREQRRGLRRPGVPVYLRTVADGLGTVTPARHSHRRSAASSPQLRRHLEQARLVGLEGDAGRSGDLEHAGVPGRMAAWVGASATACAIVSAGVPRSQPSRRAIPGGWRRGRALPQPGPVALGAGAAEPPPPC